MERISSRLGLIAATSLLVGTSVYLFNRQPDATYFLPAWISSYTYTDSVFASIGHNLPTFAHVYTFILLTVAVFTPSLIHSCLVCVTWFTVDCLFEFGQHAIVSPWIAKIAPAWFDGIPFLENTANYFLMGTFDPLDLVSIAGGTIAAFITIKFTQRKGVQK